MKSKSSWCVAIHVVISPSLFGPAESLPTVFFILRLLNILTLSGCTTLRPAKPRNVSIIATPNKEVPDLSTSSFYPPPPLQNTSLQFPEKQTLSPPQPSPINTNNFPALESTPPPSTPGQKSIPSIDLAQSGDCDNSQDTLISRADNFVKNSPLHLVMFDGNLDHSSPRREAPPPVTPVTAAFAQNFKVSIHGRQLHAACTLYSTAFLRRGSRTRKQWTHERKSEPQRRTVGRLSHRTCLPVVTPLIHPRLGMAPFHLISACGHRKWVPRLRSDTMVSTTSYNQPPPRMYGVQTPLCPWSS